jgi:hypothetical protein
MESSDALGVGSTTRAQGLLSFALPYLERAAKTAPIPRRAAFGVADYGSCRSRSSILPMRNLIVALRRRSKGVPISITHADRPTSDLQSLLVDIQRADDSYLNDADHLFAFVEGRSIYERLFPPATISVGWSALAVQWLSQPSGAIADHIWAARATGALGGELARRAAADWAGFLDHRAHELRAAGRLVVLGGASDQDGDSGADGIMDMANDCLQAMVGDRWLRSDEYAGMMIPTYRRTPEEYLQPFFGQEVNEDLELEDHSLVLLPDLLYERYEEDGDLDAYAARRAQQFLATYGTSLFAALDADRSADDYRSLVEQLGEGLQRRVKEDPVRARCHWRVCQLLIAKAW